MSDIRQISVNQLFKDRKTGKSSYIEKITGHLIDRDGVRHRIEDCDFYYYTKEQIEKAYKEADGFLTFLEGKIDV